MGDPDRLTEVFDELAANSLSWFDKPARTFTIHVSNVLSENIPSSIDTAKTYVLVQVTDNGPGIPLSDKEKVFEAFYSTSTQGTGLGLALVRRIVEGHGGAITECGNPSEGTEFEVYLPIPSKKKVAKTAVAKKKTPKKTKRSSG